MNAAVSKTADRRYWFSAWGIRHETGWCFGADARAALENAKGWMLRYGVLGVFDIHLSSQDELPWDVATFKAETVTR